MKLTLTVNDERMTQVNAYSSPKSEEYVRTDLTVDGAGRLIADTLRAVANEIDPQTDKPKLAQGGVIR